MSRGDFILAIETSNPSAGSSGVAIARRSGAGWGGLGVIEHEPVAPGGRHGDDLMPAIDRLCARAGATPADLGRVVVSVGPGGYTGLRVAVTVAKVLGHACGAELVGVPTALVAREALGPEDLPALVLLASKGEGASGWLVDAGGARCLGVVGADDVGGAGARCLVGDEHLPAGIARRGAELGLGVRALTLDARACLRLGAGMEPVGADALAPIYAREPDAVTQWRARHG